MDRAPSPRHKGDRLRLLVEKLNLRRLLKFLRTETWDVIVNTHFLPAEMIAALRRQGELVTPHLTVDHRFRDPSAVGQPAVRPLFHGHRGRGRRTCGIGASPPATWPSPAFPSTPPSASRRTRRECRRRLATNRRPAGRAATGRRVRRRAGRASFSSGILDVETPLELVVVGRPQRGIEDAARTNRSASAPPGPRAGLHHRDGRIDGGGRPGGVQAGRPDHLGGPGPRYADGHCQSDPRPGEPQQRLLLENGAAIKINNAATLPYKLGQLLATPGRLAALAANAKRLGRPQAAFDVARTALDWPLPG